MQRLALLLVGTVDRRLAPALEFIGGLEGFDARAVHVAADPVVANQVAVDWMSLDVGLPLEIVEARDHDLARSVYDVVAAERRRGRPQVLVVVPELDIGKWWQVLLHRTSGRRVARSLQGLGHVTTAVVPYAMQTL